MARTAESAFDRMAGHISREYQEKGYSKEEADKIGRETAADIGRRAHGEEWMAKHAAASREEHEQKEGGSNG